MRYFFQFFTRDVCVGLIGFFGIVIVIEASIAWDDTPTWTGTCTVERVAGLPKRAVLRLNCPQRTAKKEPFIDDERWLYAFMSGKITKAIQCSVSRSGGAECDKDALKEFLEKPQ